MSDLIKIAVDAMGGDGSPKKIIDGIIHSHKSNKKNFFKIFGNKTKIEAYIENNLNKDFYEIIVFWHKSKPIENLRVLISHIGNSLEGPLSHFWEEATMREHRWQFRCPFFIIDISNVIRSQLLQIDNSCKLLIF